MERLVMRRCCCKSGCSVPKCAVLIILISMALSGLVCAGSIYDLKKQKKGAGLRNAILQIVMKYDENDLFAEYRVMTLSIQLSIVVIANSAIGFLFGVFALYGIMMRKKYYVLPWLVFNGASLVGLTFVFIVFSVVFPLGLVLLIICLMDTSISLDTVSSFGLQQLKLGLRRVTHFIHPCFSYLDKGNGKKSMSFFVKNLTTMENLVMRKCCCKTGFGVHKCAAISGLMLAGAIYDLRTQKDGKNIRNWMLQVVMKYDENDLFTDYRVRTLSAQVVIITITNSAIAFVFGIAALYGILTRKKYFILPWLIFNGISLIGIIFIFVIFSILFPLGLILLTFAVPYAYIYIVGHSLFFRLSAAEDRARESDSFLNT
nr:uncharacterized protein LOC111424413 isoform X2 [Onthophagus taurus]